MTFIIYSILALQTYIQLHTMFTYGNDTIQLNETATDFAQLGKVDI